MIETNVRLEVKITEDCAETSVYVGDGEAKAKAVVVCMTSSWQSNAEAIVAACEGIVAVLRKAAESQGAPIRRPVLIPERMA